MEVYVLDSLFRRTEVVDRFESVIWTERFRDVGDFELIVQSTAANRRRFVTGTRLAITESVRVMTVETVENSLDSEGRRTLKVSGRSLEAVLEDRIAFNAGIAPPWVIDGLLPAELARILFYLICIEGHNSPADVLPLVWDDQTLFPVDTIPEPNEPIKWQKDPVTLYEAIKELCDIYDLGFRLYRNGDQSQLFFNIYTGSDRTTQQSVLSPVIFSPELQNLLNTTELSTIAKSKNVAYVRATLNGVEYFQIVIPDDVDPSVESFERRVVFVDATVPEGAIAADIPGILTRAGLDEVAKSRAFMAFDGEIAQRTQYKYGFDYFLGDLVSMQNSDGNVNSMRVTEQIFVSDKDGDRAYPTLAVNMSIQPGTWESWGFQAWEDVTTTEYWSNQP